jgi:hypothetical protein
MAARRNDGVDFGRPRIDEIDGLTEDDNESTNEDQADNLIDVDLDLDDDGDGGPDSYAIDDEE